MGSTKWADPSTSVRQRQSQNRVGARQNFAIASIRRKAYKAKLLQARRHHSITSTSFERALKPFLAALRWFRRCQGIHLQAFRLLAGYLVAKYVSRLSRVDDADLPLADFVASIAGAVASITVAAPLDVVKVRRPSPSATTPLIPIRADSNPKRQLQLASRRNDHYP